jgi:signal transduction histidine kinase
MDSQRRILERNLHDGAQHHLVNLRLMVGLLEHQLAIGDDQAVIAQLGTLAEQIAQAEAVLYETASGILPVSLVNGGLCAALTAEIGAKDGVTLQVPASPSRYPQAIETAIFYACLEAVTNARKHAPGAAITVTLAETDRGLRFSVRDDGPGFDPLDVPSGSGLGRLSERVGAVGGTVGVSSAPGRGTVLEGVVPL